ncbi:hypothetical protein HHL22_07210 [Hymenobacter sp. RP-2-7]|uniref:Uncharacterized protein n=1 Tax=Hymenobacter polaris TaxID=2682546 RepID=A0A7Y0FLN4_9BACT|nr:DUF6678 family protein [Hymenobacter polaris]NML64992.1 hypothetical protein [Hymenobacter polaris]
MEEDLLLAKKGSYGPFRQMHKKTIQPDDKQLDKLIAANSLLPYMSNRKWVKLLHALITHADEVQECRVKLLWEAEGQMRHLLFDENTSFGFDYYQEAMEAMVSGPPRGWYGYREIEWLDFPRIATRREGRPPMPITQNLKFIQAVVNQVGKFHIELEDNNLRVYCYLRAARVQAN